MALPYGPDAITRGADRLGDPSDRQSSHTSHSGSGLWLSMPWDWSGAIETRPPAQRQPPQAGGHRGR
jgi:hypothetical protein